MDFVKIAKTADFESVKMKSYSLMGKKVAVIRQDDGQFRAIEAACKHQGADLTKGELNGDVVTCPRHQWQYNLLTGECISNNSLPLRKYGLKVEGDDILVSLTPIEE